MNSQLFSKAHSNKYSCKLISPVEPTFHRYFSKFEQLEIHFLYYFRLRILNCISKIAKKKLLTINGIRMFLGIFLDPEGNDEHLWNTISSGYIS